MKIKIAIIALILAITAFNAQAQNKKQVKETAEITFIVSLHCKNCVKKVESNLPFEKGIKDIKVTLDDHTVWIEYDTAKTDPDKLQKAIEKLGYEVNGTIDRKTH